MSKDLEIIKKIENKIGRKLKRLSPDFSEYRYRDGYAIDENKNIIGLNLFGLKISDISSLKDLKNLTYLDLESNQISDISSLKGLKDLDYLNLKNNKISELLVEVSNWKGDLLSIFDGNPIEIPPMEIVTKGKKAVKAYFESIEGKKRVLNEVKMLLVGDGGAGKTSLVKRFLGEEFDKNEPQTHGININHWEVESKQAKIKINTWDFGGQEREQKRDYFAAVLFTLREINSSFEKLEAVEKVPMPNEPTTTVSYNHLIRLEQRSREYYEPDGSEKVYNVKDLLGTVYVEKKSEYEILQILRKLKDNSDNEETLLQKATNSVLLQPNIMGIGINLNNLIKKLFAKDKKRGNS